MSDLQALLQNIDDEQIIEEAARRLQRQYVKDFGQKLMYGTFRFIFHDGRFQGVEECPRKRRYLSPTGPLKRREGET